ncbi:hypothetical protein L2E82_25216 [Cichorium intybus]|uniref:Uncharacterized protein n=1 Tax=Cichorium intybus TaxID=13427 RepID=A0ACB9E395_CICIN|nr:hypothetical protein L2E82_25216 [Cichorium intybus]
MSWMIECAIQLSLLPLASSRSTHLAPFPFFVISDFPQHRLPPPLFPSAFSVAASNFLFISAFEDPDIIYVDDIVDLVRDLEVINAELRLKILKISIEDLEKSTKRSNDKQLQELELCLKVKAWLENEIDIQLRD